LATQIVDGIFRSASLEGADEELLRTIVELNLMTEAIQPIHQLSLSLRRMIITREVVRTSGGAFSATFSHVPENAEEDGERGTSEGGET
jgi:hypothetical protein